MKAVLLAVLCWMSLGFVSAFQGETADASQFQKLIQQLDSDGFTDREAAAKELDRLDQLALPHLNKALEGKPSLEVRRRLESLIATIQQRDPVYRRGLCEALIQQLDCYRNDQAGRAAQELRAFGPDALAQLREAMLDRDRSPAVRLASRNLLLAIKRAHDLPILPEDEAALPRGCPSMK
jgi:hypothetical protein